MAFAIVCTLPVYQTLDFPVTPPIYSFPLLTDLNNEQLNELSFHQTSGNINQAIVPSREQDAEAVQSIIPTSVTSIKAIETKGVDYCVKFKISRLLDVGRKSKLIATSRSCSLYQIFRLNRYLSRELLEQVR